MTLPISPARDKRNTLPVIVTDLDLGDIRLAWEPLDVVLTDKGHWEGINDKFLNFTIQKLHGVCTWPKRLTHVEFDNVEAKIVLNEEAVKEYLLKAQKLDPMRVGRIVTAGKIALEQGRVDSVFPFKIIASVGTRMKARFLHEVY